MSGHGYIMARFYTKASGAKMKRVVLYTQKKCPHCDTAKRYLDEHKIQYRLCSVNEPRGSKELAAIGGRGVPTLKIGDQILRGFSVAEFEKMYRR